MLIASAQRHFQSHDCSSL